MIEQNKKTSAKIRVPNILQGAEAHPGILYISNVGSFATVVNA